MSGRCFRVLVVEDNPGDYDLICDWLCQAPIQFESLRATTLAAGRDVFNGNDDLDVVLLDLDLPDSSGLDTLRGFRELAPHVPIIVVSGTTSLQQRAMAELAGAAEMFSKNECNSRLFSRAVLYVIEQFRINRRQREVERILDRLPDGVLVVSDEGCIQYVNAQTLELFGRSSEDLLGEELGFSVANDASSEVNIIRNGRMRTCSMRLSEVQWEERCAVLVTLRDITEQRQMETQLATSDRMVTIGMLAAGVAHEINNPLASVITNLDVAHRGIAAHSSAFAGATIEEEVRDARLAAEHLRLIVRDLQMFSRPTEEESAPICLKEVVESTLRMARSEVQRKARLALHLEPGITVHGNKGRLGQVLLNVIINAAQATPAGDATNHEIRVSSRIADGTAFVEVKDTGAGMPEWVMERMFTTFFTTKKAGEGTGLGLAISRQILEAMGGSISFDSVVGQGTTCTIRVPLASPLPLVSGEASGISLVSTSTSNRWSKSPGSRDGSDEQPGTDGGGSRIVELGLQAGRVLVVDDEPRMATAIQRLLRGHSVVLAHSGSLALERLESDEPYDVILCDIMMPEMTGIEFYETIRERGLGYEERIVFMTGGSFFSHVSAFLNAIPNRWIEKPFATKALRSIVDQAMSA